jgi:predicted nucleic acid-binding protein
VGPRVAPDRRRSAADERVGYVTSYLLDTTALIDFSKGREPALSRIGAWLAGGDDLGVCAINVAEFYTGVAPAAGARWDYFLSLLSCWPITLAAARQAGVWRHDFARRGVALSTADTLVAPVASDRGARLVTDNSKDYPMAGVQVVPLRT